MTLTGGATHGGGNSRRHGSAQQHHSEAIVIEEIACGHPIDAIEQTARKTHSRIVVMGAIARSGVRRFFFGNTAEALLDLLDCDLLIVKPPGFAPRVQKRARGVRFAALPYLPGM